MMNGMISRFFEHNNMKRKRTYEMFSVLYIIAFRGFLANPTVVYVLFISAK